MTPHTAIEIKSSKRISKADLKALKMLTEEKSFKNFFIVSQDEVPAKFGSINSLHWKVFLQKLWNHQIL